MSALVEGVKVVVFILIAFAILWLFMYGDIKALRADVKALKALTREVTPPTHCRPPGTPQARICNYSLVVTPIEGDFYKGYVNKAVVEAGAKACEKIEKELQEYYRDFECAKAEDYKYAWYGFKIEGDKPPAPPPGGKPQAHNFINLPNTGSLKLGTVPRIEPVSTPIDKEFTELLKH